MVCIHNDNFKQIRMLTEKERLSLLEALMCEIEGKKMPHLERTVMIIMTYIEDQNTRFRNQKANSFKATNADISGDNDVFETDEISDNPDNPDIAPKKRIPKTVSKTKTNTKTKSKTTPTPKKKRASDSVPESTDEGLVETAFGVSTESRKRDVCVGLEPKVSTFTLTNDANGLHKLEYAKLVTLSQDEYDDVVDRVGVPGAKWCIEKLNAYKGSAGKEYASDYYALTDWCIQRYHEHLAEAQTRTKTRGNAKPSASASATVATLPSEDEQNAFLAYLDRTAALNGRQLEIRAPMLAPGCRLEPYRAPMLAL
jgi:hypothetical protein